jgi:predicted DNA-binding protein YlxM (UPF0122 family)
MNFIDNLLQNYDKEKVVDLFHQDMSSKEISEKLNMSEDWVKDVIAEENKSRTEFEQELNDEALEEQMELQKNEHLEDWAENHGALLTDNGWIV